MTKNTALIFEPQRALAAEFSRILKEYNVKTENVTNVHSALKLLGSHVYDVVLFNYSIIQKEDDDILKKIVSSLQPQSSLIVTGEDNQEYCKRSIDSGASTYCVTQPFNKEKLSLIIKHILEKKLLLAENIRLRQEAQLLRYVRNIALSLNPKEFSSALLDSISDLLQCDYGYFAILDKAQGEIEIIARKGIKATKSEEAFLGLDTLFLKKVMEKGKPLFIEDAQKTKNIAPSILESESIKALYLWPIMVDREALGIAVVAEKGQKKTHSKKQIFFINKLLKDSSLAIKNVLSFQKISGLIIKDDITNAFNRRFFEAFMEEEIQRSKRYKLKFSVIFIDLNNFKRVNELYGHSTGSRMLGMVSSRMFDQVRSVDRVIRYGGDEFCIILPETDAQGAFMVARRIKENIEREPFRFGDIKDTYITASFGISTYPQHGITKKRLISLADKAMFEAKKIKDSPIAIADEIAKLD
jgi:two-component system cell cycle response regulator